MATPAANEEQLSNQPAEQVITELPQREQIIGWRDEVAQHIDEQRPQQALELLDSLPLVDRAEVVHQLEDEQFPPTISQLTDEQMAAILDVLDREETVELAERIDQQRLVEIIKHGPIDLVADLVRGLEWDESSHLLTQLRSGSLLSDLLKFNDDDAGGIMTPDVVALGSNWTVPYAIDRLRKSQTHPEHVRQLFVVDGRNKLLGWVELSDLIFSKPGSRIKDLMNTDVGAGRTARDEAQAAEAAQRYHLLSMPVVDDGGLLKGAISADDLNRAAERSVTDYVHRIADIGSADGVRVPLRSSIMARFPWLMIHIAAVALVATFISLFESTLTTFSVLVAHMAMVMNQTGVIGNQVNIVTIRALGVGDITARDLGWLLWREYRVLAINGVLVAAATALFVGLWRLNPWLGLVVFMASLAAYFLSVAVAVAVPIAMRQLKVDPAVSSGTILTTLTDVFSSISFLILATIFLSLLVD